ncbi:MAG TPA: alkaline phosphatase family protein [Candidatus Acidoferrales bacterium]|nr:alkaline phosphatase family protein [Candidatus Acidoferrales bacterium]
MPANLDQVETIVILMMENRSFDHMLGYLSMPSLAGSYRSLNDVNGLKEDPAWLQQFANEWQGQKYWPIRLAEPRIPDPPHERVNIQLQMGGPDASGKFPLSGFVANASGDSDVMNYQSPGSVAVLDFFARNYRVCDRWFSCLPAGTQPNRLMAMSGHTLIDTNQNVLPNQLLAYDWLTAHQVRWRVYHQGFFPFFAMMPRWAPATLGSSFRPFDQFANDIELEPDDTFPQVIFIEPIYSDAPHAEAEGSDDHSPSSVYGGQCLMHDVYVAMVRTRRWDRSVLLVTYDEHGGFFDHEQPLQIETAAPGDRYQVFETSGIRVPAAIVSPFVSDGTVFHGDLDHTSILKFLGERFGMGGGYSPEVDKRALVGSVGDALDLLSSPRSTAPAPPLQSSIQRQPSTTPIPLPNSGAMVDAFAQVHREMKAKYAYQLATKFPASRTILGF